MDNILPFILETLSNKPLSEETEKNLLKELRQKFRNENLKSSDFKQRFEQAIETGRDLGIFRLIGENIRLPFSLGSKKSQTESKTRRSKSVSVPRSNKLAITEKERRSSSRGRRSSRRRQSRSRSRSGARSRSQRRRRVSRR